MKSPEYVLVVHNASHYVITSAKELCAMPEFAHLRMLVLTPDPAKYESLTAESIPVEIIRCSFKTDKEIVAALRPFKDRIRAAICRGEKYIQYFRKIIPHLPPNVLTATSQALEVATNKRLMREAFRRHCPEINPQFVQVHDASEKTIAQVEEKLEYPVIIKPANLASSMLITACRNRYELAVALGSVFAMVESVYKKQGRDSPPQVIVEEYLEGDFYSVDAYVTEPGKCYFCPVIGYVLAKQLGIDDFSLYKRFIPTKLTGSEIAAVNETAAKAIMAVGLTHSSVHVELVLTKHGWKIIELGPRLGRFRHLMYQAAYGIDHSMNDMLVHLGKEPVIPTKLIRYCGAYSIYPEHEGTLRQIQGIETMENSPAVQFLQILARPGDVCLHAKNGGEALAEFVIAHKDAGRFSKMAAFVEDNVKAIVE